MITKNRTIVRGIPYGYDSFPFFQAKLKKSDVDEQNAISFASIRKQNLSLRKFIEDVLKFIKVLNQKNNTSVEILTLSLCKINSNPLSCTCDIALESIMKF